MRSNIVAVATHPNGCFVAVGESKCRDSNSTPVPAIVRVFSYPQLECVATLSGGNESTFSALAFAPLDGFFDSADSGSSSTDITKYQAATSTTTDTAATAAAASAATISANGVGTDAGWGRLASIGSYPDHTFSVWECDEHAGSGGSLLLRTKASGEVTDLRWSPHDEGTLVTGGRGHISFWHLADTFTGRKLQGELGRFGKVDSSDIESCVHVGEGRVLSSSSSGYLLLWEAGAIKAMLGALPSGSASSGYASRETGGDDVDVEDYGESTPAVTAAAVQPIHEGGITFVESIKFDIVGEDAQHLHSQAGGSSTRSNPAAPSSASLASAAATDGRDAHGAATTAARRGDATSLELIVSTGADGYIRWWSRDDVDSAEPEQPAGVVALSPRGEVRLMEGALPVIPVSIRRMTELNGEAAGRLWQCDTAAEAVHGDSGKSGDTAAAAAAAAQGNCSSNPRDSGMVVVWAIEDTEGTVRLLRTSLDTREVVRQHAIDALHIPRLSAAVATAMSNIGDSEAVAPVMHHSNGSRTHARISQMGDPVVVSRAQRGPAVVALLPQQGQGGRGGRDEPACRVVSLSAGGWLKACSVPTAASSSSTRSGTASGAAAIGSRTVWEHRFEYMDSAQASTEKLDGTLLCAIPAHAYSDAVAAENENINDSSSGDGGGGGTSDALGHVLAGFDDGTLRVLSGVGHGSGTWAVASVHKPHSAALCAAAFSNSSSGGISASSQPDCLLATASTDGEVFLFRVSHGAAGGDGAGRACVLTPLGCVHRAAVYAEGDVVRGVHRAAPSTTAPTPAAAASGSQRRASLNRSDSVSSSVISSSSSSAHAPSPSVAIAWDNVRLLVFDNTQGVLHAFSTEGAITASVKIAANGGNESDPTTDVLAIPYKTFKLAAVVANAKIVESPADALSNDAVDATAAATAAAAAVVALGGSTPEAPSAVAAASAAADAASASATAASPAPPSDWCSGDLSTVLCMDALRIVPSTRASQSSAGTVLAIVGVVGAMQGNTISYVELPPPPPPSLITRPDEDKDGASSPSAAAGVVDAADLHTVLPIKPGWSGAASVTAMSIVPMRTTPTAAASGGEESAAGPSDTRVYCIGCADGCVAVCEVSGLASGYTSTRTVRQWQQHSGATAEAQINSVATARFLNTSTTTTTPSLSSSLPPGPVLELLVVSTASHGGGVECVMLPFPGASSASSNAGAGVSSESATAAMTVVPMQSSSAVVSLLKPRSVSVTAAAPYPPASLSTHAHAVRSRVHPTFAMERAASHRAALIRESEGARQGVRDQLNALRAKFRELRARVASTTGGTPAEVDALLATAATVEVDHVLREEVRADTQTRLSAARDEARFTTAVPSAVLMKLARRYPGHTRASSSSAMAGGAQRQQQQQQTVLAEVRALGDSSVVVAPAALLPVFRGSEGAGGTSADSGSPNPSAAPFATKSAEETGGAAVVRRLSVTSWPQSPMLRPGSRTGPTQQLQSQPQQPQAQQQPALGSGAVDTTTKGDGPPALAAASAPLFGANGSYVSRRTLRLRRRVAREEVEAYKRHATAPLAADAEAIATAEETVGDLPLKMAVGYTPHEKQHRTVASTLRAIQALDETVRGATSALNEAVAELGGRRAGIVAALRASEEEATTLVAALQQLAAQAGPEAEAECDAALERHAPSSEMASSVLQREQQQQPDTTTQPGTNAAAAAVAAARVVASDTAVPFALRALTLRHALERLRASQKSAIEAFDLDVSTLRSGALRHSAVQLSAALRRIALEEELGLLTEMQHEDDSLRLRIGRMRAEHAEAMRAHAACTEVLAERREQAAACARRAAALHTEFDDVMGGPDGALAHVYAALLRLFRKRVKPAHRRASGGGGGGGGMSRGGQAPAAAAAAGAAAGLRGDGSDSERGESSEPDDEDDDADDDDDDEQYFPSATTNSAAERGRPDGIDDLVYARVVGLRDARQANEDAANALAHEIDDTSRSLEHFAARLRTLEREQAVLFEERDSFHRQQQSRLNKVECFAVLRANQIVAGRPAPSGVLPPTLEGFTLLARESFRGLKARVTELEAELAALEGAFSRLHEQKAALTLTIRGNQEAVRSAERRCAELQVLKFGKEIDVAALDRAPVKCAGPAGLPPAAKAAGAAFDAKTTSTTMRVKAVAAAAAAVAVIGETAVASNTAAAAAAAAVDVGHNDGSGGVSVLGSSPFDDSDASLRGVQTMSERLGRLSAELVCATRALSAANAALAVSRTEEESLASRLAEKYQVSAATMAIVG